MIHTQIDPAASKATFGPASNTAPNQKLGLRWTSTSAIFQGDTGTAWLTITASGTTVNGTLTGNALTATTGQFSGKVQLAASSTAAAGLNFPATGVAPTSPINGDMWFDGTDLKIRIGGVTKTVTVV